MAGGAHQLERGEGFTVTDAAGKITVAEGKEEKLKKWAESLEDLRGSIDMSIQVWFSLFDRGR